MLCYFDILFVTSIILMFFQSNYSKASFFYVFNSLDFDILMQMPDLFM